MRSLALLALLALPVLQDDIHKLVEDLKSDEIEVREKAEKKLLEIGEKSIAALERALPNADTEVQGRIKRLIATMRKKDVFKGLLAKRAKAAEAGPKEAYDAVRKALGWLARHQSKSGAWGTTIYDAECKQGKCAPNPGQEDYDVAVTSVALAAFLGAGISPASKEKEGDVVLGPIVKAGLEYLVKQLDRDGYVARDTPKYLYAHAWATLALCEAAAIGGPQSEWMDPAKKAAGALEAARNPGAGWRYSIRCGDNDTSVTMTAVLALTAAKAAGIAVNDQAFEDARAWFDRVTDNDGRVGYTHKGTGKVFIPGVNEQFNHHETLTVGAAFARVLTGSKADDVASAVAFAAKDVPSGDDNDVDYYYWYWGAHAVWQIDGPKGDTWKAWQEKLFKVLIDTQNGALCKAGSWEPVDRWSGEGGRVYATAMNALTLEVFYRYARVLEK